MSAEKYAEWIVANQDKKGTPEFETVAQAYKLARNKTTHEPEKQGGGIGQTLGNFAAGAVRGAGSIGATLLTPIDMAARGLGIQNDWIGRTDRRQAMTEGLRSMGANPESIAFQAGKIGGELS